MLRAPLCLLLVAASGCSGISSVTYDELTAIASAPERPYHRQTYIGSDGNVAYAVDSMSIIFPYTRIYSTSVNEDEAAALSEYKWEVVCARHLIELLNQGDVDEFRLWVRENSKLRLPQAIAGQSPREQAAAILGLTTPRSECVEIEPYVVSFQGKRAFAFGDARFRRVADGAEWQSDWAMWLDFNHKVLVDGQCVIDCRSPEEALRRQQEPQPPGK